MAQFYKILKANPLGDPYNSHGKDIQTYWCQFEGVEKAVSMGKQVPNTPGIGTHVYGDLMYAKSQKGTEYWKFKSAKVPEGVQRPADSPAQATAQAATGGGVNMSAEMPDWFKPIANQIDYIFREMRKMDDNPKVAEAAQAAQAEEAAQEAKSQVEQVGGEPLDEATKATLDELFGDAPEPEV